MHTQLGAAVPGEQPLFVAVHPHGALHGVVICKVPDKFSHKPRALVKLCIQTAVKFHLKLLAEHLGSGGVQTCHSVCTVLAHHHGLVLLCPEIQLLIQTVAGSVHVAGKVVPAVVAVDADDIHGAGGDIFRIVVLAADEGDRAVLRVQLMRQLIQRVPVIVGILREVLQIRLVAKAPQHHAGVVFVPMDHLGKHLPVMLRKGIFLVRIHRRPAADAHRRGLVHHQNALPVAQVVEFLGVGVVAGAHGIGVCPVDQVHVLHVQYRIKAASMGGKVLVLAKALEVKRLSVQKHLCAPHLNAAHAKGLIVDIRPAGDVQGVQVGRAGSGLQRCTSGMVIVPSAPSALATALPSASSTVTWTGALPVVLTAYCTVPSTAGTTVTSSIYSLGVV